MVLDLNTGRRGMKGVLVSAEGEGEEEIVESKVEEIPLQVAISSLDYQGNVSIKYNKPVVVREVVEGLPPEILDIRFVREIEEQEDCSLTELDMAVSDIIFGEQELSF